MRQRFSYPVFRRFRAGDALTAERLNALAAAAENIGLPRVLSQRGDAGVSAFASSPEAPPSAFHIELDPKSPSKIYVHEGSFFGDGVTATPCHRLGGCEMTLAGSPSTAASTGSPLILGVKMHAVYVCVYFYQGAQTDSSGISILRPGVERPVELVYWDIPTRDDWLSWKGDEGELEEDPMLVRGTMPIAEITKSSSTGEWTVSSHLRRDLFFACELNYPELITPV